MKSFLINNIERQNILNVNELESLYGFEDDKKIFEHIINNKIISFENLANILSTNYNLKKISVTNKHISNEIIKLIPYKEVLKYKVIPIDVKDNALTIGMTNPFDYIAVDNISLHTNLTINTVFIELEEFAIASNRLYTSSHIENIVSNFKNENIMNQLAVNPNSEDIDNAPAVKILNQIFENAVARKASDIHIEPQKLEVRVRYRIDGKLIEVQNIDHELSTFLVSRIKIISGMDIAQKRMPQEGIYKKEINKTSIEFRISSVPIVYGEKIAIRLIYNILDKMDMTLLGFLKNDLEKIQSLFKNTNGLVLVTGTTGSGKTTTLSSFINQLNTENVNIVTIEDPVENIIMGVNQISINPKNGFDFADALKFILRQDPDIIMVGEIRDSDTAIITVRSAMTGHLVFSTLHTNNAVSSITRLIDMGIPSYLITSTLKGVISQKLVRKLCDFCKIKTIIKQEDAIELKLDYQTTVYENIGCIKCDNTGYKGRFAIYEILIMDKELKNAIKNELSEDEILKVVKKSGMKSISENMLENVLIGNTTIQEMYKEV
jgi:type IV pilus assembly protein PilB